MPGRYGGNWLDISTMLKQRPDGHMPHDCGHWCLPGPYDIGAKILFNAMLGQIDAPIASLPQVRLAGGIVG